MSEEPKQVTNLVLGVTRKSLEAIKIYACPHCNAPGVYKNDDHNRKHWPGIVSATLEGKPVGDICPNCNKPRRPDKNLGELTASMPRWMWNTILAAKWFYLKVTRREKVQCP